jgi:hypothetical protein
MSWASEELSGIDLEDKRLNKRCVKVLENLSEKPSISIPSACSSWSETLATYRLMSNKKVTSKKIMSAHIEATHKRLAEEETILMLQDTSELHYSTQTKKEGIGPINSEYIRGYLIHPTIAVTPDRLCLGVIDDYSWYRETLNKGQQHKSKLIEEKESYRWLLSYRESNRIAQKYPATKVINIADREGDIYEFFEETAGVRETARAEWIIRAAQNRLIETEIGQGKLREELASQPVAARVEFNIPGGRNRKGRTVKQEIYYKRVKLKPPSSRTCSIAFKPVELTAIFAKEVDVCEGEEAISWMLLTSLELTQAEEAIKVIEYYLCRWQIEVYFKILKSGCQIEELQFVKEDHMQVCVRFYMIIAWRILYLTMLGRRCPDLSCDVVFEECEWKSVYIIVHKKQPPDNPPSLNEMIKMVASFGGYIQRKNAPFPGAKTLWVGLQRMHDFAIAWEAFHSYSTGVN